MNIFIRIGYSIIFLGLVVTCTPETSPPSVTAPPVEEPSEITHWLQENAISLASTEPLTNYDDLLPLKDLIGDAEIVALGSSTLGTHEFFTIQNRLLDFLARELNFNLVFLDVNMPEAEIMNDYIQEGLGKPRELLGLFYKWNYNSEEMLDIIYWMRNFRHNGSLEFKGMLARYPLYAMYQVVYYLNQVDTTAAFKADSLYLYFRLQHRSYYDRKKEWLKQVCREGIIAVHNILLENQALYISLTSEEEFARVLRLAYFVIQVERYLATLSQNIQYEIMAENVDYFYTRGGPGTKIILLSHSQDVAKKPGSVVDLLINQYGYEVKTMGFIFSKGFFNAQGFDTLTNTLAAPCIQEATSAPQNLYEYYFNKAEIPAYILSLRYHGNPTGSEWLDGEKAMRSITDIYFPASPELHYLPCSIRNEFDFIVFVNSTIQTTFLF